MRNLIIASSSFFSYTIPPRLPFKRLQQDDIQYFQSFMNPQHMMTDPFDIEPHNISWIKKQVGQSKLVLAPQSTKQISQILNYCNGQQLAVVPQGGNTGLVGGSVPIYDEIILSMKNMNTIQKFDPLTSVLTAQGGVILAKANEYLQQYGHEMPLDLGSRGSCQIGGNAATNAGGIHMIKHGSFRSHILGVEAVMANGKVLDMCSQIHKDNTGYDLKGLLIGSEGTLGVITKLNIHCARKDKDRTIFFFKASSYKKILKAIPIVKRKLGNKLCALEYLDGITYNISSQNLNLDLIPCSDTDHILLVETTTIDVQSLLDALPQGFNDSIMSQSDEEFRKMWMIRQAVAAASLKLGRFMAFDISYSVADWQQLVRYLRNKYSSMIICAYGHIGDGNIHLNFCSKDQDAPNTLDEAEIYRIVASKKGSISAEHGVGIYKPSHLKIQKSAPVLDYYRQIKHIFDPNGILNPYKVLQSRE